MSFLQRPATRVFLIVFAVGLAWAIGTGQVWEDFYITYRASRNLADGRGLTYNPGTRVHSFTSPLGVLLPAASYELTGRTSDRAALWIFRLMSLSALGGAAALLWSTLRTLFPGSAPAALLTALLATDSKTIGFSANGMETGFVLLFLAWSLWAIFTQPARRALHLGLAWGGLMWSRPDACLYIAATGLGILLCAPADGGFLASRARWCRQLLPAAGWTALLYAPWFGWAWWYYGSPVPHTIVAKGLYTDVSAGRLLGALVRFPFTVLQGDSTLKSTFLPYYDGWAGWSEWIPLATFAVGAVPFVLFLLPFVRWEARLASFVFAAGHFYLTTVVGPWPWYIPPVTVLGLVAGSIAFGQALGLLAELRGEPAPRVVPWLRRALWGCAAGVVLGSAAMTGLMARQARLETTIVAEKVRGAVGLWLRAHAKSPSDTVFLEPLGYIGFYSNLTMLDFPGLASPEVVAARRRASVKSSPGCWPELIRDLRPDWLVLRPSERAIIDRRDPRLVADTYEQVRIFDAAPEIARLRFVPVPAFLAYDGTFEIYRRRTGSGSPAANAAPAATPR